MAEAIAQVGGDDQHLCGCSRPAHARPRIGSGRGSLSGHCASPHPPHGRRRVVVAGCDEAAGRRNACPGHRRRPFRCRMYSLPSSLRTAPPNASLASVLSAMLTDQSATVAAVDRVRAPTLLIWGARERHIPRVLMDDLIARRSDWRLQVLEESGHVPTWDSPGAYVDAVVRWADTEWALPAARATACEYSRWCDRGRRRIVARNRVGNRPSGGGRT